MGSARSPGEVNPRGPVLHIVSLALGGCLKGEPVRYGITEDTGGHITYILGEMEALARRGDVEMAEIITRRFDDPWLGAIHAEAEEWLGPKLVIRRIDSGNRRYLAKEALSADRAAFTEALIAELKQRERLPDLIHAHFADAADVARKVEDALGIPFIYTAHSLGMDKRMAMPAPSAALEARIAEEDRAIAGARAIIGSSRDECERQLAAYPSARIGKIHRLIPGIDRSAAGGEISSAIELVSPFLREPMKPVVLAIARPVHKKNLVRLVEAFGKSPTLRERCNLVVLAGLRDDLQSGEAEQQAVLRSLVDAIDRHDLYGKVAYPKSHTRQQVKELYTLAARTRGAFVNPALMEPYGLTLVEAAAHGVPVVATKIGGPQDIVGELEHGLLVDPGSEREISQAIERLVTDRRLWETCSHNGQANSREVNWDAYARGFMAIARQVTAPPTALRPRPAHLLVSDLDNTLTGCDRGALRIGQFFQRQAQFGFVIATGRSIVEARRLVRDWKLPDPRAWITSVGTEIYVERGGDLVLDTDYADGIGYEWHPTAIDDALDDLPDLIPQASYEQRPFKRSYFANSPGMAAQVEDRLRSYGIPARVVFSHDRLLDVLPPMAGKAAAMGHVARMFDVPVEQVFAAGDSGNDEDMLTACQNAIMVGNHAAEIAALARRPNVYLARRSHAAGTLEGILAQHRAQRLRERRDTRISA